MCVCVVAAAMDEGGGIEVEVVSEHTFLYYFCPFLHAIWSTPCPQHSGRRVPWISPSSSQ